MINFVTPHCHIQSLDTASTPQAFIDREIELGTGAITCTDHGTMAACRTVYDLARKKKLTPILGVEAYFRDDACPILASFGITDVKSYAKYFHITIHYLDQEAYEAGVRVLSRASLNRMEKHGTEYKPLYSWADLEELAQYNVTFTTGCLIGMVQRHLIIGHERAAEIAEAYYMRLKSIAKAGHFFVEMFPHKTDKNWVHGIFVSYADGTEQKFHEKKKLRVDSEEVVAADLAKSWKGEPKHLQAIKNYSKWDELPEPKMILDVRKVEEFMQNECFPWCPDGDSQKGTNRFMRILAKCHNDPILVSDDSHYAHPADKIVQDIRLQASGDSWRFYGSYHRQSSEEAYAYFRDEMGITQEEFEGWVENNRQWAERFKDFRFEARRDLPVRFYPGSPLLNIKKLIDKHGRMDWSNEVYVQRLKDEIQMLANNGTIDLLPYFFPIEEVASLYESKGELTGPGRGSAAGLLLTYLLGITHVDPLKYGLSKERFLTLDRIQNGKLPDIDFDLPHRNYLVDPENPDKGWLRDRFGEYFAQVSTDTTLKVRSSIKDVARVFNGGVVPPEINKLAGKIPQAPQGIEDRDFVFGYKANDAWVPGIIETDPTLQQYARTYPEQWDVVSKTLGLQRQKSRHACAFVITNEPVANFIPLTRVGGHIVTQYTAKSVEAAGGLKMDFLIINILNDISAAIKMIQERVLGGPVVEDQIINGRRVPGIRCVPFNGRLYDVWDLPEDQSVYNDICESDTETVFQFNTNGAKQFLRLFNRVKHIEEDGTVHKALDSIESLAAFTALDRPGPLDAFVDDGHGRRHNMLVEYANRAAGEDPIDPIPVLDELLPETYGVIVYQEQLQRIFQTVGKTTAVEADNFRVHVGKKMMADVYKDRDVFMRGAVETVGEQVAEQLWGQMVTFGQYGFNKSHAVCYVVISYSCAFLKKHYPLEWWTAVLRNADRNEIDEKFWRYCGHLVNLPDIRNSGMTFEIVGDRIQAPLWLLHGVGKKAHERIVDGRPYTSLREFVEKDRALRIKTAKPVTNKAGEQKLRLGASPLNRGVVSTLIVSGAMDSLFPPDSDVSEKLRLYEEAYAEAYELKRPRPIDPAFLDVHQITRFQMRKKILPAYSEPILPMLVQRRIPGVAQDEENGAFYYRIDGDEFRFVTAEQYERLSSIPVLPKPVTVAVAAYVISDRRFKYQGTKEACELVLDHDGGRIKAVKWPSRDGKLPKAFRAQDFAGTVAIVLLNKYSEKKDFVVEDVIVAQPALGAISEEESHGE